MPHRYEDIPLRATAFGRAAYRRGRRLVERQGVRLDRVVWDADEVLWDWAMDGRELLGGLPGAVARRDVGHREYYRRKPGMCELLWGMRHASLERGWAADVRIWTNGYPWRLWRIGREIPGLFELLGVEEAAAPGGWERLAAHPGLFFRGDYVDAMVQILDGGWPDTWPTSTVGALEDQLERDPYDSSFKLPELAEICGKSGFDEVAVIVDDHRANVERFAASGRHGVHVAQETPSVGFGRIPNVAWGDPHRVLGERDRAVAPAVATGLARLIDREVATIWSAPAATCELAAHDRCFAFDVPDERLREEWIEPVRRLRRRHRRKRARGASPERGE